MQASIGPDLTLLRTAVEEVENHGCSRMTRKKLVQIHKAESRVKYFLMPHKFKWFDYTMARLMIQNGEIKIFSFDSTKEYTGQAIIDPVQDEDSDEEELGSEEIESENAGDVLLTKSTTEPDRMTPPKNGEQIDSINLLKFSANPLVPAFVLTLFRFLPEDESTPHPLDNLEGKIKVLFSIIASVARSVRIDGAECNHIIQDPTSAFREGAMKQFRWRHNLLDKVNLQGNITAAEVVQNILHPDKLLASMLMSFLRLDPNDETVKAHIKKFIKEHVQFFPNTFLAKKHGENYSRNRWWKVAGFRNGAFPAASADDSSGVRQQRNLQPYRRISRKMQVIGHRNILHIIIIISKYLFDIIFVPESIETFEAQRFVVACQTKQR